MLNIHSFLASTEALGPYRRFALWTQGCMFDCPGCMSKKTHDLNGGKKFKIKELVQIILASKGIEGLTISGGEPFLQAKELLELVTQVKRYRELGVIVYSGYTFKELQYKNSDSRELLQNIDILIDGRYEDEWNDNISLRGSSNQKIYLLSDRYKDVYEKYYESYQRKIEIYMQEDGVEIVGVPQKRTLGKIRDIVRRNK